jgi:hypothetical protein
MVHKTVHVYVQALCHWTSDFLCFESTVNIAAVHSNHALDLCILSDSHSKFLEQF